MLAGDSQLRWIGPEKGAIHLAGAALVNAAWDLRAKREEMPLWRLLAGMSPEELVDVVDFTYISDMITPAAAVELLREQAPMRAERIAELEATGYPAYTTSAGWLGYDDDKIRTLCREAVADGFNAIKMKVGSDLDDDHRRAALLRERDRARSPAHDRREPAMGRRPGHRLDARPRGARSVLDRGADEP